MARTIRDTNLETRTARARLGPNKKHWRTLDQGRHIGYRRAVSGGTWIARYRRDTGTYTETKIGTADDTADADGISVLSFSQAQAKAREIFTTAARREDGHEVVSVRYTVGDAIDDYLAWYEADRAHRSDHGLKGMRSSVEAFIRPPLGNVQVRKLSAKRIRDWLHEVAERPPRLRTRRGKRTRYRDTSKDPDAKRKRRQTANRILAILKAALNHAWREGKVEADDAWRRVRPFQNVDAPRVRYLSADECARLVNACPPDFRQLVQAGLFTGCRWGELIAMEVGDHNPDAGTVLVRESKSGKSRHVVLPSERAKEFFGRAAAGREANERLFVKKDGAPWGRAHQHRRMADACEAAKIRPRVSFHILRHTHASQLAMNGAPMGVIAAQLGHADQRMAEKHYAHLAPSYVADTIRATFPDLDIFEPDNVAPMRR